MDNITKDELTSNLSNYFDPEKSNRLIESNESGARILYCLIIQYEYHSELGLDLAKLDEALYDSYKCYNPVKESDLELLIQDGFLIKEDGKYFIPRIRSRDKLRQEKENGQQFLFPDLMNARLNEGMKTRLDQSQVELIVNSFNYDS